MTQIWELKRAYDPAAEADGLRVLVDRLWPRGLSKERAAIDLWAKDLAPSSQLRTWWHHQPDDFDEFVQRYRAELDSSDAVAEFLTQTADEPRITLIYAARNTERNHAAVLLEVLREAQEGRG